MLGVLMVRIYSRICVKRAVFISYELSGEECPMKQRNTSVFSSSIVKVKTCNCLKELEEKEEREEEKVSYSALRSKGG